MLETYHKIQSVFKRDPETDHKTFTDEYASEVFDVLSDVLWVATEKIDGTNIRLASGAGGFPMADRDKLIIRGRTDRAQLPPDLVRNLTAAIDPARIPEGMTLYGEGYGAGIQKGGGKYRPDQWFVLFDATTENGRWLERGELLEIAADIGVAYAPILGVDYLHHWVDIVKHKAGWYTESKLHPEAPNEGLVLRPKVELNWRGGRVITKLKFSDWPDRSTPF